LPFGAFLARCFQDAGDSPVFANTVIVLTKYLEVNEMIHRGVLLIPALCLFLIFGATTGHTSSSDTQTLDFYQLLNYIEMEDLQDPLELFEDHEGDFDKELNQENIAYLNDQKDLLKQIQGRLKAQNLKWRLAGSSKRILFVPEKRPEYARLFESYCRQATTYVLERLRVPSPYTEIATLEKPLREPKDSADHRISAYLVHNLADEYVEEYIFYNADDDHTKIKIKLSNRLFHGKIGSYTSNLKILDQNRFEFIREPYTIWQNSSKNPLNVFIAPIEETLHIVLRGSTEEAIRHNLQTIKPTNIEQVQQVVNDWMAVEEAIVGGLVYKLLPDVFRKFFNKIPEEKIAQVLAERECHQQYRYLSKGVQLVNDMGLDAAVSLYQENPQRFKSLVTEIRMKIASS
jgi:hypothetical protein